MLWIFQPPSLKRRSGTLVSGADDGFVTGDIKHWDYGPRYSHQGYRVIHSELGLMRSYKHLKVNLRIK